MNNSNVQWTSHFGWFVSHFERSAVLTIHCHVLPFWPLRHRKTSYFGKFLKFCKSSNYTIPFPTKYALFQTKYQNLQWPISNVEFPFSNKLCPFWMKNQNVQWPISNLVCHFSNEQFKCTMDLLPRGICLPRWEVHCPYDSPSNHSFLTPLSS